MNIVIQRLSHFMKQINRTSDCWEWKQSTAKHGYGQFWDAENKKNRLAHRVSYYVFKGEIPQGYHIDHLCRNRACVNPAHLEAVTQAENNRRMSVVVSPITHCKRGHEFTPENTYIIPSSGSRQCKTCKLEHGRYYLPIWRNKMRTI